MSCVGGSSSNGWVLLDWAYLLGGKALSANAVDLDCRIASATKQQESSSIEELSFLARTPRDYDCRSGGIIAAGGRG